ncbi:hypothetical protein ABBQ38_012703 [Trebouxia sp. C0009 RCD-2024]
MLSQAAQCHKATEQVSRRILGGLNLEEELLEGKRQIQFCHSAQCLQAVKGKKCHMQLRDEIHRNSLSSELWYERPAAHVGRPALPAAETVVSDAEGTPSPVDRGERGRTRKRSAVAQSVPKTPKQPRGRPRKQR